MMGGRPPEGRGTGSVYVDGEGSQTLHVYSQNRCVCVK